MRAMWHEEHIRMEDGTRGTEDALRRLLPAVQEESPHADRQLPAAAGGRDFRRKPQTARCCCGCGGTAKSAAADAKDERSDCC